ncbi:MAG: hypothetical protein LBD13_05080, partial [Spirochaetaceae bacterium]|nr:hypothetical protein [Spirochaetaceae bacterium]
AKITPNIKPAIILNNNTQDTVRVYYQNNLITNGEFREDFAVVGGVQEFITGFEQTQNIQNIKFKALAWTSGDKTIQNDVVMQNNKVYIINLTNDGGTLAPHTEQNPNPAPIDDYIR